MQSRRYIFIDYEDLLNIKFKKIEKICTRIFVFVHSEVTSVPMYLVQQMQKMGKDVKWISVENSKNGTNFHISFLMGKLHEKVSIDIEFAILSNEDNFDPLVNFINNSGRNCLRVKRKMTHFDRAEEQEDEIIVDMVDEDGDDDISDFEVSDFSDDEHFSKVNNFGETPNFDSNYESEMVVAQNAYDNEGGREATASSSAKTAAISKPKKIKKAKLQAIEKIAEETIRRLIRSGNRPSEMSMLKSYILLHYQDEESPDTIEMVIEHMKETKDIRLEVNEVIYNF